MARRDLRRHKIRAALTALLVALPVFVATIAALVAHNDRWDNEREAHLVLLGADAGVTVTGFSAVRPQSAVGWSPRRTQDATRRDPAAVDVAALLPAGSVVAPRPQQGMVSLLTGGSLSIVRVDLDSPLTDTMVDITAGRAPSAPDEVALPSATARELGLLDVEGTPRADARLELVDDVSPKVVGVFAHAVEGYDFGEADVVAPIDSTVAPSQDTEESWAAYLVDLPPLSTTETRALVDDLAAEGVALRPRDAIVHPEAWGLEDFSGGVDLTPVIVGALCVLVGLVEVVLLVGAAFSVAARRQVRDLGLLATNGGAAVHVRRVLLAQGLVLGVLSSALGVAAGVAAFRYGAQDAFAAMGRDLWRDEISWPVVVAIGLLGATTSVIAALLPGWKVSRLTPLQALSGRFPLKPGESRAHRPAFVLAGAGLAVMLAGGWAVSYADGRYPNWIGAAAVVAGLGLVALVAGAAWCTPYVVRRSAELGRALPLSGRYAFRDAGRHRFRTGAAVIALMVTVAGAVLAAFGFASASRVQFSESMPAQTMAIDLWGTEGDPERVAAAVATVDRIVQPVESAVSLALQLPDRRERYVELEREGTLVQVVDEQSLRLFTRVDPAALEVFRAGGAVTTMASRIRDGQLTLAASGRDPREWTLPAAAAARGDLTAVDQQRTVFVSRDTVTTLGLTTGFPTMVVRTDEPIPQSAVDRLQVYGIYGWTDDPERAVAAMLQFAGLGAAGLLTALVVGIAVALAAAESRDDVATLAAVGAGPWRRRGFGAMHGLFIGLVGSLLGVAVGVPAGVSLVQVDGMPGVDVPWLAATGTVGVVLALAWVMGGIVTPSRFRLTRRVA
ncbi:MAG TPA: FtsX-like permease family protein [Nocardioidaceae bacterium]|nr:FtsX-like permease family protein [Nocardioidaceae bacterium]